VAALTVPYVPQRAAVVPLAKVRDLVVKAGRAISTNLGAGSREAIAETTSRKKA
jgi:hypothetical protein